MKNANSRRKNHSRRFDPKKLTLLLSVVLLLGAVVGGTVAYLTAGTGKVTNTFTPGHVDCVVSGSGNRFTIAPDKDTNTNVYLRAAVVGNWVDGKGNVYWMAPSFEVSGSSWNKVGDYYYYQSEVAPGGEASELTVTLTSETPEGYTFQVQVLAEAIQSAPAGQTAWDNGVMN